MSAKILISSVTSSPTPQAGQSSRSSGNFSTDTLPPNTINFQWEISSFGSDDPNSISFSVAQDVSGGSDPTIFTNVVNGKYTDVYEHRSLYIAKPNGATANFVVSIFAITR
ncbi:DeoR family transcriptional regulator [Paenibacillus sp. MMS18-CY102]|uniref:DeoR family transcriptional regulator n=1 Tax=Paenibacillus sp. MMS18-CY102 TaxID=2682849 RepID=UPI0013653BCF|nr:DeoR family transcriptional regulator [Paenibacillus sp. MMS18-CY102]MWC29138.1 DeoR family transcriptional regulator [Paenibacillus sp. MMS18-CY102]